MTYPNHSRHAGHRSAQTYASVGLETQVLGASPEQLISLLFQGALTAIAKARIYMQKQDIAGRGMAISKAIDIVESGLKSSVNTVEGGDVADNLILAYDMVIRYLLRANLEADEEHLLLAETILAEISQAWGDALSRLDHDAPSG